MDPASRPQGGRRRAREGIGRAAPSNATGDLVASSKALAVAASPAYAARRTRPGGRCARRDALLRALKPAPVLR
jgi:hypothetical protein